MTQTQFTFQTRKASWDIVRKELGRREGEVFDVIAKAGAGLTAWEIHHISGIMVHVVRPRLTKMRDDGILRTVGKRFYKPTERMEAVWEII